MSWGSLVNGINGRLPIDDDFDNLIYRGAGWTSVSDGIHDITLESRGIASLIVATRHPGIDVALLSYLSDRRGTTGVRVYVEGRGRLYWRTYEAASPLSGGWGVEIRNAAGKQVFHSDHRYADVRDSRFELGGSGYLANDHFYLFNAPAVPRFEYETKIDVSVRPDRRYQQTGTRRVRRTRRVYQCWYERQYVNGRSEQVRVCGYVSEVYYEDQPVYDWVTVGWWTYTARAVMCRKTLAMTRHNDEDYLSNHQNVLADWETCYTDSTQQYTMASQALGPQQFPPGYMNALSNVASGTAATNRITGHNNRLILME